MMGNHHSHTKDFCKTSSCSAPLSNHSSLSGSRKNKNVPLSRSASGADIQEKSSTHLMPVEKLAKMLLKKSQVEENVQAVTKGSFCRYVFPRYPVLADKLYHHFHATSAVKDIHLNVAAFKQQCERFLAVMEDDTILLSYVRMYSGQDADVTGDQMSRDSMRLLLMTAYRVAMDHYSEGPQMCLHIQRTLTAVVDSCFHHKSALSSQYVAHWLSAHCPRLLLPLHRYVVHCLATAHRSISEGNTSAAAEGIELATPVLEQPPPFGSVPNAARSSQPTLLPMSAAWLLAGALPPLYTRPTTAPSSSTASPSATGVSGMQVQVQFLAKLVSAVPSHWVLMYSSDAHGHGANRFLHHVLAYRGPTLCLFHADAGGVFCIASPNEWHESHLYWGGEESTVLQLWPKFLVVERGPKMLYLNTTVRGYPMGLRAGKDPRKPVLIVDGTFDKMKFHNIPYGLVNIEVWACGDQIQRETQLDIKKWQAKEAERQRCVKLSAADWLDHPDRYLLELAGRPQYNNQNKT